MSVTNRLLWARQSRDVQLVRPLPLPLSVGAAAPHVDQIQAAPVERDVVVKLDSKLDESLEGSGSQEAKVASAVPWG